MNEEENKQRDAYVKAATDYIGTPYHHMGRIKGAGVDCATLLICAGVDSGLLPNIKIDHYPGDWHLHRGSERYLAIMMKYVKEVKGPPKKGDIVIWKFGRSFSHAAIVIDWPQVVHARMGRPVVTEDALAAQWLTTIGESGPGQGKPRPMRIFSIWGEEES